MMKLSLNKDNHLTVPLEWIGPIAITGPVVNEEISVPLATFETPLWPSVNRGARVTVRSGAIHAIVTDDRMTRSILLQTSSVVETAEIKSWLESKRRELDEIVKKTSRFARLLDLHFNQTANLLFIRFEFSTGDASGHNMATKAADKIFSWILQNKPRAKYVSISGNYCTDKKNSSVNAILGRGKKVIAEILIPEKICKRYLKTDPCRIVDLNIKKNLIGSIVSGAIQSANAHYANMLLAFYLATGQDAANIVEASQGITHAEKIGNDLYFTVSLPNIIVGTVGSGKNLDIAKKNLQTLGCLESRNEGENAKRLAVLAACTVLCGELSLLSAQTNPGELMNAHERLERG
jgi:hydroxymethylglutaryl-CoA reductase (NADPH)